MTSIIDFKLFYINWETSVSQLSFNLKLFDLFDFHRFIKTHWKSTIKIIQLLANQIAIIRSMMWINVDACSWETNLNKYTHMHALVYKWENSMIATLQTKQLGKLKAFSIQFVKSFKELRVVWIIYLDC